MAANIMTDLLNRIQQDLSEQKQYMKNMQNFNKNINEKFNLLEGKISHLDKKLDEQQLSITIIKHQVQKSNVLLFGNGDQKDDAAMPRKLGFYDEVEKCLPVVQTGHRTENPETSKKQKGYDRNLATIQRTESNCGNNNNKYYSMKTYANGDTISKEYREIEKYKDYSERNSYNEETLNLVLEQMAHKELKKLIDNELREMKKSVALITDVAAVKNANNDEATNSNQKKTAEFVDFTNGLQEIKESIAATGDFETKIKTTDSNYKQTAEFGELTSELREIKESIAAITDFVTKGNIITKQATNLNQIQTAEFGEFTNGLREIKESISSIMDFVSERDTIIEEAMKSNHKTAELGEFTNDLRKIKESITSIGDLATEINTHIKEADNTNKQTTELSKLITTDYIKELMLRDDVAERKQSTFKGDAENTARELKTVQFFVPAYFSPYKIRYFNEEFKRIATLSRSTGVYPVIELVRVL